MKYQLSIFLKEREREREREREMFTSEQWFSLSEHVNSKKKTKCVIEIEMDFFIFDLLAVLVHSFGRIHSWF